jgi:hypothetical protein
MRCESKLAKNGVEEAAPLGVVVVVEVEGNWDVETYVDTLENGSSSGFWWIEVRVERGVGVGRVGLHGCESCGERIKGGGSAY